jgi:hypothetical protein
MLDRIAAYLTQEIETRKMVVGASIYPGIIDIMAISTTVFLLTFVLPRFAGVFKGKEEALPAPTQFLMGLSSFMVEWWWALLAGAVVGVIAFLGFIRTEIGGLWWDRFKISAPIVKRMFRALYISRSLQTMGELLNAGVPMLDTIAITGDVSGNRHYKRLWRSVYGAVKQGKKVQSQLQRSPLLPRSVVQMISAGEESGKLGEVLDDDTVETLGARILREEHRLLVGAVHAVATGRAHVEGRRVRDDLLDGDGAAVRLLGRTAAHQQQGEGPHGEPRSGFSPLAALRCLVAPSVWVRFCRSRSVGPFFVGSFSAGSSWAPSGWRSARGRRRRRRSSTPAPAPRPG